MKIYKSIVTGELMVKMPLEEYAAPKNKEMKNEAPVEDAFLEIEVHKDSNGKPYAYTCGGVTSTEPPMCVGRNIVIF